jgi:hypothetical protein
MSSKKKYAKFSTSYVDSAKEAGIESTYIPNVWKIFFRSATSNSGSTSYVRNALTGKFSAPVSILKGTNVKGVIKKAAPKKVAAKKAAPKKAAAKKAAPKKAAAKKASR